MNTALATIQEPTRRWITPAGGAQQAVMLAPESARALRVLMAVLTVSGDTDEALKVRFEVVRRNPFDTDIRADLGARLTQAGPSCCAPPR